MCGHEAALDKYGYQDPRSNPRQIDPPGAGSGGLGRFVMWVNRYGSFEKNRKVCTEKSGIMPVRTIHRHPDQSVLFVNYDARFRHSLESARFHRYSTNKEAKQRLAKLHWKVVSNNVLAYIRARRFCVYLWQQSARRRLVMFALTHRIDMSDLRLLIYKEADILRLTPKDVLPNKQLSIERRLCIMRNIEKHDEKVFSMIV